MFIFLYKNEQLENLCSITKMIIMQKKSRFNSIQSQLLLKLNFALFPNRIFRNKY